MPKFRAVVMISTFNGQEYLHDLLKSICAQKNCEIKVLIRDDGSKVRPNITTASLGAGSIYDIEFLCDDLGNIGPAKSFMRLVEMAPEGYDGYFFCDQDDVWLPEKVEKLCSTIKNYCEPTLICSNVAVVDKDLSFRYYFFSELQTNLPELLYTNIFPGCGMCFNENGRKLLKGGHPDNLYMHDWYAAILFLTVGRIIVEPDALTLYRQHGSNLVGAHLKQTLVKRIFSLMTADVNRFRRSYDMAFFIRKEYEFSIDSQNLDYLDLYLKSKFNVLSRFRLIISLNKLCVSTRFRMRIILSAMFNKH